jgi:CRISPR-associated protein Csx10
MMAHIYLPVTATSPLTIRADHAQEGSATAHTIPGATMLGSLAAAHRILYPENDADFTMLFLNEQVSIPYLYPAVFNLETFQTSNSPVVPLPKTAQSCKRFQGFQPLQGEIYDDPRHGVRDSLFDWGIFKLLSDKQRDISALLRVHEEHKNCKYDKCTQTMDHITGYYRYGRGDYKQQRMKAKVETHLQTRTGINRDWGIVEEGILYNREVFDEGMRFWGEVILPDELADTFMHFVEEASEEGVIRVGTGRTRGLGRVKIGNKEGKLFATQREGLANFSDRLARFDEMFQKQVPADAKESDDFYFAITLYSPTILCDTFMRYCTTIDARALARELQISTNTTFTLLYQATETQRITGWNEMWGTPRANDYAMETGSTFLFASSRKLDNELLQALYTLEETGLGRRRAEGFGRLCISDPFHLQGEQA